MKFIKDLRDGEHLQGIYLCKQKTSAVTKKESPMTTLSFRTRPVP